MWIAIRDYLGVTTSYDLIWLKYVQKFQTRLAEYLDYSKQTYLTAHKTLDLKPTKSLLTLTSACIWIQHAVQCIYKIETN